MSFKEELTAAYFEMLDLKVSLGYSRQTYKSFILPFIDFCADYYPNAKEISKEMLDRWLMEKSITLIIVAVLRLSISDTMLDF